MEKSKVYFTDFHTIAFGDSLPAKLKKLIKKAGIADLDMDGKFVAITFSFPTTDCNLHKESNFGINAALYILNNCVCKHCKVLVGNAMFPFGETY